MATSVDKKHYSSTVSRAGNSSAQQTRGANDGLRPQSSTWKKQSYLNSSGTTAAPSAYQQQYRKVASPKSGGVTDNNKFCRDTSKRGKSA